MRSQALTSPALTRARTDEIVRAMLVWLNGRVVDPAKATVSIVDRGYLLGDSVFETMRAYDGRAFAVAAHLERFERAAATFGMVHKPRRELRDIVDACVRESGISNAYVRIMMSRGEGAPGLGTQGCDAPTLSVIVRPLAKPATEDAIRTTFVTARKIPAACIDPTMKTGSHASAVLAKREIEQKGIREGVVLGVDGRVVCGVSSNIFLVKNRRIMTPDAESGPRLGVTREVILELARDLGIEAREGSVSVSDLLAADEIFFASTLVECLPVRSIDDVELSLPGPITTKLRRAFAERVAYETRSDVSFP